MGQPRDEHDDRASIDRRRLLGLGAAGLGALGAASAVGSSALAADGDTNAGGGPRGDATVAPASGDAPELGPPLTPGRRYHRVQLFDWLSNNENPRTFLSNAATAPGAFLVSALHIEPGSVIRDAVFFAHNSSAGFFQVELWRYSLDGATSEPLATVGVPPGTALTTPIVLPITPFEVSTDFSYNLEAFVTANTQRLGGARIGYSEPPRFVPITPARVYDSRQAPYPVTGVLGPNSSRVLSVADARDTNGNIITTNVVPVGATAIAYNLTIASATGPNFFAITPGDATSFTASAINFPGGDDRANGGIVKLDATRQVKVWGGDQSGSAHVLLDVTGYYV